MEMRSIRAFHYTRLTDTEVERLRRDGIHLSTPTSLRDRLDAVVASGELSADLANRLYAASPFHSDQREARSDKFWMTSYPLAVDDRGVVRLLESWGGEVASWGVQDEALLAPLRSLGKPRILEIAVPMSATEDSYGGGCAVVNGFARSRGSSADGPAFDLYTKRPLPPTAVLAVHSEGSIPFETMGQRDRTGEDTLKPAG